MPSRKAYQLTFNIGYTGDGQPLSVSWLVFAELVTITLNASS